MGALLARWPPSDYVQSLSGVFVAKLSAMNITNEWITFFLEVVYYLHGCLKIVISRRMKEICFLFLQKQNWALSVQSPGWQFARYFPCSAKSYVFFVKQNVENSIRKNNVCNMLGKPMTVVKAFAFVRSHILCLEALSLESLFDSSESFLLNLYFLNTKADLPNQQIVSYMGFCSFM